MATIREDLVGVVTAYDAAGVSVVLVAGDDVPEGVVVGDHLLAGAESKEPKDEPGTPPVDGGDDGSTGDDEPKDEPGTPPVRRGKK